MIYGVHLDIRVTVTVPLGHWLLFFLRLLVAPFGNHTGNWLLLLLALSYYCKIMIESRICRVTGKEEGKQNVKLSNIEEGTKNYIDLRDMLGNPGNPSNVYITRNRANNNKATKMK